jgi:DNA integrity scanning protein DisA with diadenylate cyclase activity
VFDRFGEQYFLREIHLAGNVSLALPLTGVERRAAERLASGTKSEVVVVRTAQ